MNKKLCLILITVFISALFCGCDSMWTTSNSHKYLISALGFDIDREIKITAEAVAVNSEDSEGTKRLLIEGTGKTPEEALNSAKDKATHPFDLSHCGVIILSSQAKKQYFDQICDYLYDTDEITFSAYLVTALNSEKMLKAEPLSSIAVGYDIMSILQKEKKNKDYKNSLYQVVAVKEKGSKPTLPFLKITGKYREITDWADINE